MRLLVARLGLVLVFCLGTPLPAFSDPGSDAEVAGGVPDEEAYDPLFDDPLEEPPVGFPDPAEETNRNVEKFNGQVDKWVLDPVTRAYGWLFPNPVKRAIRRFFSNLGEPATMANDLLQLEWKDAGVSGARFLINTTVGVAGFFDVAGLVGLEYHSSDFGQTLALAGTPSGAYLILPIAGPNDVRDTFGVVVDMAAHPLTWVIGPTNFLVYGIYTGSQGLSLREHHIEELEALRESSVDPYAVLRSAYYQNRMAQIWGRREDRRDDWKDD